MAYTYIVENLTTDVTYDTHSYVYGESAFNAFWSMGSEDANSTGKSFSGDYDLVAPKWSFYGNWKITNEKFVNGATEEGAHTYEDTTIDASGAFTNNGTLNFIGDGTKSLSFTAGSFVNSLGKSVTFTNATFNGGSTVTNNGTFTASGTNKIVGTFTGTGSINLSGVLSYDTNIAGTSNAINVTTKGLTLESNGLDGDALVAATVSGGALTVDKAVVLKKGASLSVASLALNDKNITLNDASLTVTGTATLASGKYIYVKGISTIDITEEMAGAGYVILYDGSTLKGSTVKGMVKVRAAAATDVTLSGENTVGELQVLASTNTTENPELAATIAGGKLTATTIRVYKTSAINAAAADVTADNLIVATDGAFNVTGASKLAIGKMVPATVPEGNPTLVGGLSGTITVGAATTLAGASIYEAADKTATVVISDETKTDANKVTLSGTNTITADIVNNGQLVVNGTLNAANIDSNYVLSFSGATVEAGTIKNASSANVTTIVNSNVTADEIDASIGSFIVKGSSGSTLKVGSATKGGLSGKITMQGASAPSVIKDSAIYKKDGAELSQVELANVSGNGVSFSGTNVITADIVNNATTAVAGNFSAGKITKQTGTGAYEGASITAANGAVLNISDLQTTILVESTLGASTISSKAENGANLSATGAMMTLAGNVAVSNITVTADAITLNKDVVLTIDTESKIEATAGALSVQLIDEKKQTASIVVDGSDLTYASTIGSKPLVVTATGIDDNISYNFMNGTKTLVVTDTEDPEKTKTFSLAKFENGIYLLENQTQDTLYVNPVAYHTYTPGQKTADNHIKGYNAFDELTEFMTEGTAAGQGKDALATTTISLGGGKVGDAYLKTYMPETAGNYLYYYTNNDYQHPVTLTGVLMTGADASEKVDVEIAGKSGAGAPTTGRFYLSHAVDYRRVGEPGSYTYEVWDGDVNLATAENYKAPTFIIAENLNLKVNSNLMVGEILNGGDFNADGTPKRTGGVGNLIIKGIYSGSYITVAPYSRVEVTTTGKVLSDMPYDNNAGKPGSHLKGNATLTVTGTLEDASAEGAAVADMQYRMYRLAFLGGGSMTLNNTRARVSVFRFGSYVDPSVATNSAIITLNNTYLDTEPTEPDTYDNLAYCKFFSADSADTPLVVTMNLENKSYLKMNKDFNPTDKTTVNVTGSTIDAETITNAGEINASNGAVISSTGAFRNEGTINIGNGEVGDTASTLEFTGGAANAGGTIKVIKGTLTGGWLLNWYGGSMIDLENATFNCMIDRNDGTVKAVNSTLTGSYFTNSEGGNYVILTTNGDNDASAINGDINNAASFRVNAAADKGDLTLSTLKAKTTITGDITNAGTMEVNTATINGDINNTGSFTAKDTDITAGVVQGAGTKFEVSGTATVKIGSKTNNTVTGGLATTINVADGAELTAEIYKKAETDGEVEFDATTGDATAGIKLAANSVITASIDNKNANLQGLGALETGTITNEGKITVTGKLTAGAITNTVTGASISAASIDAGAITNTQKITTTGNLKAAGINNSGDNGDISATGTGATITSTDNISNTGKGKISAANLVLEGENKSITNGTTTDHNAEILISTKISGASNSIAIANHAKIGNDTAIVGTIDAGSIENNEKGTIYAGSIKAASITNVSGSSATVAETKIVATDITATGETGITNNGGTIEATTISGNITNGTLIPASVIKAKTITATTGVMNAGTIEVTGGEGADNAGSFNVGSNDADNTNGTIELDNAVLSGGVIRKGTINAKNGSVITTTTDYSSISLTGSTVAAAQVDASGAQFTVEASATASEIAINSFIGTINVKDGAKLQNSTVSRYNAVGYSAALVIADGANVTFTGTNAFNNTVAFTNNGALTIDADVADCLTVVGNFTNAAGSTITIDATGLDLSGAAPVRVISVTGDITNNGSFSVTGASKPAQVIVGADGIYLSTSSETVTNIVVNHAWDDASVGQTVYFGGNAYVYGIDAFCDLSVVKNLTSATKTLKFANSTVTYGTLNLNSDIAVSVRNSSDSGVGNKAVFDAANINGAKVTFDAHNIDFGSALNLTNATVSLNGDGLEAETDATSIDATSTLNVLDRAIVNLATLTGAGTINTDVESTLSFTGSFAGTVDVDVNGLTWTGTAKTFDFTSTNAIHFTASDSVAEKSYADSLKYFEAYTPGATAKLTQRAKACNVYNVEANATAAKVLTAVNWSWTNDAATVTYYADNVVLNGTSETVYLQGNSADQTLVLNGTASTAYKAVYGGKLVDNGFEDGEFLGKAINLTVNGGTYNQVVVGGDRINVTEGRNHYYRDGGINLTINGGTFMKDVATGMLYQGSYAKGSVDVENTQLTITGGEFMKHIYGGNYATTNEGSKKTTIYGTSTVELNAVQDITIHGTLFVGSIGNGIIEGGTNLILKGSKAIEAGDIWGGSAQDKVFIEDDGTRIFVGGVEGERTLTFTGFTGNLDECKNIHGFSSAVIEDGTQTTLQDTVSLVDVNNWEIEAGSTLDGAFKNDFKGDKLLLTGLDTYDFDKYGDWTIFGNTENFTFGEKLNINGKDYNYIAGGTITLDEGYDLSFANDKMTMTILA